MKYLLLSFLILLILSAHAATVPITWYSLSEENNSTTDLSNNKEKKIEFDKENKDIQELEETFQKYLSVNESAISHTSFFQNQNKGLIDDWKLDRFIFSMGIGLKGTLGLVTLGGKGAFEFHYLPQENTKENVINDRNKNENTFDLNINSLDPRQSLQKEIDRVAHMAFATKKIKNESVLKSNLQNYAQEFLDFALGLEQSKLDGLWDVYGLEMLLSIEASGKVLPEVDVGGELRLRLRWKFSENAKLKEINLNPRQKETRNFIQALSDDLTLVSQKASFKDFKPNQIDIGLAFTGKGTIAIAKAKGELEGRVILKKNTSKLNANWRPRSTRLTLDLSDHYKENVVRYAREHGISYEIVEHSSENKDSFKEVIYHIGRQQIRNGLTRTFKMTEFFLNLADGRWIDNWQIRLIKTRFDFSVEGVLPMVTIGGRAVSEITFVK